MFAIAFADGLKDAAKHNPKGVPAAHGFKIRPALYIYEV